MANRKSMIQSYFYTTAIFGQNLLAEDDQRSVQENMAVDKMIRGGRCGEVSVSGGSTVL